MLKFGYSEKAKKFEKLKTVQNTVLRMNALYCSILVTVIVHSYVTDDVTHSQNAVATRHQGNNRLHGV